MRIMLSAVFVLLLAVPAAAQRPRVIEAPTFATRMSAALNAAERAMYERERLELSEEQVEQLDALRRAELDRLAERDREVRDWTSRHRAGLLDEEEFDRLSDRSSADSDAAEAAYERFESILTEEQREEFSQWSGVWRRAGVATDARIMVAPYGTPRWQGWNVRPAPRLRYAPRIRSEPRGWQRLPRYPARAWRFERG